MKTASEWLSDKECYSVTMRMQEYAEYYHQEKMKEIISDEEIDIASKELRTKEEGQLLPGELKAMNDELLRIGFVVGAKYCRSQIKADQGGQKEPEINESVSSFNSNDPNVFPNVFQAGR